MSLDTYANLKTEIAGWLDRDDLTSYLDTFIDLAEQTIFYGGEIQGQDIAPVRVREMEDRQEATLSTSSRYLAVPTGFLEMKTLHISSTTPIHRMSYAIPEQINDFYDSGGGKPNYFSIVGTEIAFERVPDSAYTIEMAFFKKLTALSDDNTTNDILTNYPGLYLYGSLCAAEPYLANDERMTIWLALYKSMVSGANKSAKRGRNSGSALQMRSDVYPS